MSAPRDLCDLASAKGYIVPALSQTTASDAVLGMIISGVSRAIESYLGRELMAQQWTELRNGTGRERLTMKHFPIFGVSSVTVDTHKFPAAGNPPTESWGGFTFDDRFIYVGPGFLGFPRRFMRGFQNVEVVYSAGYLTPGMIAVAALPGWSASTPYRANSEIIANGYVFATAAGGTSAASAPVWPAQVGASIADGEVTWQATAASVSLFGGAGLLPEAIKLAALQQVALVFKQRTRVGDSGSGEGPQRVSYMNKPLHPTTREMLDPYRDWGFPGDVF
ncbi:MAG: hypothetical protein ACREFZ_03145 [Acetobacteraceae bacterium]